MVVQPLHSPFKYQEPSTYFSQSNHHSNLYSSIIIKQFVIVRLSVCLLVDPHLHQYHMLSSVPIQMIHRLKKYVLGVKNWELNILKLWPICGFHRINSLLSHGVMTPCNSGTHETM